MSVLCSASAMEIVIIRSRKLKKPQQPLSFILQCKIKLPVIIYSNSDN